LGPIGGENHEDLPDPRSLDEDEIQNDLSLQNELFIEEDTDVF